MIHVFIKNNLPVEAGTLSRCKKNDVAGVMLETA
jgi:hypothetical protein